MLCYNISGTQTVASNNILNIDGSHKLLDLVEQMVALLDDILVLRVLLVGTAGFDDVPHLVNLRVQAPSRDKARQLRVQQLSRYPKRRRHGRQHHTAEETSQVGTGILTMNLAGVVATQQTFAHTCRRYTHEFTLCI